MNQDNQITIRKEHIDIMTHTRDKAAAGMYCGTSHEMRDLVNEGLMEYVGKVGWCPDEYFKLTKKGVNFLKENTSADVALKSTRGICHNTRG